MSAENIDRLAELIKDIQVAMLTTVREDGSLRARPMVTQKTPFDGVLWFFTRAEAPKVSEVQHEEEVCVAYASPSDQRYVSVSGKAHLVRDPQKIKELWSPALRAWFPNGPDDPQTALLRVDAEQAEYWDSKSSTLVHLVGFVKAMVTGQPYKPGDNQKVDVAKER